MRLLLYNFSIIQISLNACKNIDNYEKVYKSMKTCINNECLGYKGMGSFPDLLQGIRITKC